MDRLGRHGKVKFGPMQAHSGLKDRRKKVDQKTPYGDCLNLLIVTPFLENFQIYYVAIIVDAYNFSIFFLARVFGNFHFIPRCLPLFPFDLFALNLEFGPITRGELFLTVTTGSRESRLIAKGSKALHSVQDPLGQFPVKVDDLSVGRHKKQRTPGLRPFPRPKKGKELPNTMGKSRIP